MARVNSDYKKLQSNYLFAEVNKRVGAFQSANPNADIIRLGIGDVTQPLAPAVLDALHTAVDEMGVATSFKGYAPYEGYDFLRELISKHDFHSRGVDISLSEIYVSDGAKSDTANLQEIFAQDSVIAVTDPVYPVYVDSNVMAGRTGSADESGRYSGIVYLPCGAENGFVPDVPSVKVDIIYLCFPNNPTGAVATKAQLKAWVDYARSNGSIIIYDAAYEAYIQDNDIPHSIYEIDGAKEVAIECRSFSKTAGFTGTRCGYTVIPNELMAQDDSGNSVSVAGMWLRRQSTKYNGTAYVIQAGAAAVYSPEGQKQVRETINYYMDNANIISRGLSDLGLEVYGGKNAPYIWLRTPGGLSSWEFFDKLLNQVNVVGTPGSGFGSAGEGYFRLTAFGNKERTREAVERFAKLAL